MEVIGRHASQPPISAASLTALRAMAEPTRARIVALLGHGERCVCEVVADLGLSTALVSHHLRVLRNAGLLGERRSGRWVYYSLDLANLARVRADLDTLLTPSDADATECLSSDCSTKAAARQPFVFGDLPNVVQPVR